MIIYDELEEMVSYRKNVTGIDHTIFISPRGNARHAPRIKVAIDPPDSLDPRSKVAVVSIYGDLVAGKISGGLLLQILNFIDRNREAINDYWEYRIDTDELRQRLHRIDP